MMLLMLVRRSVLISSSDKNILSTCAVVKRKLYYYVWTGVKYVLHRLIAHLADVQIFSSITDYRFNMKIKNINPGLRFLVVWQTNNKSFYRFSNFCIIINVLIFTILLRSLNVRFSWLCLGVKKGTYMTKKFSVTPT